MDRKIFFGVIFSALLFFGCVDISGDQTVREDGTSHTQVNITGKPVENGLLTCEMLVEKNNTRTSCIKANATTLFIVSEAKNGDSYNLTRTETAEAVEYEYTANFSRNESLKQDIKVEWRVNMPAEIYESNGEIQPGKRSVIFKDGQIPLENVYAKARVMKATAPSKGQEQQYLDWIQTPQAQMVAVAVVLVVGIIGAAVYFSKKR